MWNWNEAKNPALKAEEAAMLPALPRSMAGGAALKEVMNNAEDMLNRQLSEPKSMDKNEKPSLTAEKQNAVRRPGTLGALRQVWNRP